MGIITSGNGRVKCARCGNESGSNASDIEGFITTIEYDSGGYEISRRTLCLACQSNNEEE